MRRYLIEGVAAPGVFASMLQDPQDRGPGAAALIEKAGGRLIDYYLGVSNCKNYIIAEMPGPDALAELLMVLYGSGAISNPKATELMSSKGQKEVFERAGKLAGAYSAPE